MCATDDVIHCIQLVLNIIVCYSLVCITADNSTISSHAEI